MVKPEVRLDGFNDDWREWRLGDWGATYGGLTGKTKRDFGHGLAQYVPYLNVFSNPVMDQTNLERTPVDTSQNQVKAGDILFTTSSEVPEEVGMSSVVFEVGENVYLNSFCFGFRPNRKIVPTFWAPMLRGPSVRAQFKTLAQGISRFNISPKRAMDVSVHVPTEEEQEAVGEVFTQMDAAITQSEVRLEKLRQYKQIMLHKMFPSGTSRVPEIRFEGFEGEWIRKPLSSLIDLRNGKDYKHLPAGSVPVYGTGGYMASVGDALSWEHDAIGIGRKGTIDRPYMLRAPFWTVDTLFYAFERENTSLSFLMAVFLRIDWKSHDQATGLPSLTARVIEDIEIDVPSVTEQHRIGAFFSNLDALINAEEDKLLKFKNLKVTFLAKMLV